MLLPRRGRSLGLLAALGVLGAAAARVTRLLLLLQEEPVSDGAGTKKGEKKDFKKKGNGPRTRRKKAKKGK
jgi:hypothetical protein